MPRRKQRERLTEKDKKIRRMIILDQGHGK